jgi:hypothetical protein
MRGEGGRILKNDVMAVHNTMYTRAVSFACDGRAASPYGRRIARFQPPAPIKHNVDTVRLAPRQTGPINYFGVSFILLLTRVSHVHYVFCIERQNTKPNRYGNMA